MTDYEKLRDEIFKITEDHIRKNIDYKITEETELVSDLGYDSLDQVELMLECEAKYGIEVSDADIERIKTVKDAINCVMKELNKQQH